MKNIFIILFCFISLTAGAQYYESNVIYDPLTFVTTHEVNKSVYKKDIQILKENKVKEVLIKNEDKKHIGKLLINNFGCIEDFYTYNDSTENVETHWRYSYDANNNMTSASLRQGRLRVNYILSYENNLLASIHCDSAGTESQYDFVYVDGKIFKVTLLNLVKDTLQAKYYFNYNNEGQLTNVLNESRNEKLFSIDYNNTSVHILGSYTVDLSYNFKDSRIDFYAVTYIFDNPASAIIRRDKIKHEYLYSPESLIKSLEIKSFNGKPIYKEYYEYSFYE